MSDAPPRRSVFRLSPDQRIADIVAAARAEIAANGYEATSMLSIASRAGVVEGTVYRFFKTKQELMLKVAEDWLEEILTEDSGLASIRGTWNQLRYLIWRTLDLLHSQPAVSRFVLIEMRPTIGYRSTRLFGLNRRFTGSVRAVCEAAIHAGEFRQDVSPSLLRDMIFGCIEHRTWAFLRGEADFAVDAVADSITDVIYRGMAVESITPETLKDDRIERVIARLETAAERIEHSKGG